MLGVATLIIVMAVMNGFRKELLEKILGLNGHLLIQPLEAPLTDWQRGHRAGVAQSRASRLAAPIVDGKALASSAESRAVAACSSAAMRVRGSASSSPARSPTTSRQGTLDGFDAGRGGVAIGKRLAEKLSVACRRQRDAGRARAATITPIGTHAADQDLQSRGGVRDRHVRIRRRASSSCRCRRRRPISAAPDDVTAIEVYVTDPDQVDRFRRLDRECRRRGRSRSIDWRQLNTTFFGALQVERNVMFLIVTLIILVAAFNIISGLIMLVKDKGGDIAHPAHHRRHQGRGDARVHDHRHRDRRRRDAGRPAARRADLPQCRDRSARSCRG